MRTRTKAAAVIWTVAALWLPLGAQGDILGGALGGALFGGLIGGGDGAAVGALVGGVAGAAHEDSRRRQYQNNSRARYEAQRMDWERQRMHQEQQLHEQRMRAQQLEMQRQQQAAPAPVAAAPAPVAAAPAPIAAAPAAMPAPVAAAPASSGDLISDTQRSLKVLGYDPGTIDGQLGPGTVTAIKRYQQDKGLLASGKPSAPLLTHMRQAGG